MRFGSLHLQHKAFRSGARELKCLQASPSMWRSDRKLHRERCCVGRDRWPCYSGRRMALLSLVALYLAVAPPGFGQASPIPAPELPKNPGDIFALARPFYDYGSPELKPWHMRVSYQLFDESGKASDRGNYEYWWASPHAYRSTWTRPGSTHTDW